ncbi:zinc-binding alcohol dehydrogenase [Paenactinomyces guangxiensis]|uniref:Zinc-binding alcohol dehydrogenase n=1 Tax=Paenactinomyces guangxiensis TaxID=1490290 RepID=A0A7W1WP10_9BACL|nr:zinc-binding alcohol dehydrogenase [Paenactinomyces guangxiensis]MBA4493303.1 zinc-binding alcohol dehydrogenase [Paenactinomyces guangxiensis]MBH8589846.1 zinc-binding alcohol dehydrogenase [Paenactinomyces guangxiensis]
MKVIASREGQLYIIDVPIPEIKQNFILVKTEYSAVSTGTELLILKQKHKSTRHLGYSATGIVMEVGEGVTHVSPGQRVACYGAPYVKHAEYLLVPKHLAVPVPDRVDPKEAAFVGLGAIAIHALRQANLHFGEAAVIVGLGILGQIMAQVAFAASFKVIAHDILLNRCKKLQETGVTTVCNDIEELEEQIRIQTNGQGADSVLLCVNEKKTNLIDKGLAWIRDRGKVVIVGDLKTEFSRELMFRKEAQVLISRAGGPGRYDVTYERDGIEYPIGFVRWPEGRNSEEYIRLCSERRLKIAPLITQTVSINEAPSAYDLLVNHPPDTLGVLIQYK